MADQADDSEKTEDPSHKKLEDAHKKGDVAKSQEVGTWFVLVGSGIAVAVFSQTIAIELSSELKGYFEHAHLIRVEDQGAVRIGKQISTIFFGILILPMLSIAMMGLAGNLVQHRLVWSFDPVKPKFSKISPKSGFKRLFSKDSLINFLKGLIKLGIVSGLMFGILYPERDVLDTLVSLDISNLLPLVRVLALKLFAGVIGVMTIIAGVDFLYQKNKWFEKQKMTVKEVKDEFKQMEGDPIIKAKLRQIRQEKGRQRMMANVPDASLVLVNPTHYSIALKYETGMNAPVCIAKGIDGIALKIREVAREHDIPVIENPSLTRALYATVEIDDQVPEEHFKAVAEIIGFVMKMSKKGSWRS
ncbi:MAG: flagellar biosynthesis protein FlhB [Cohaesibacteraceae bacterium]|nr:flagellar biosynthesis protein FlhB [Cohaesibacteraceae bacterium]MBL4875580.1 flagellar biosynthesis protein FlhB [Cohaesibacteraceae bacterium]